MKNYTITLQTTLKDEENVDPRLYNLLETLLPYLGETGYLLSDCLDRVDKASPEVDNELERAMRTLSGDDLDAFLAERLAYWEERLAKHRAALGIKDCAIVDQ